MKNASSESGSVFVEDGIRLFENTRRMLIATTQDLLSYKPYHRGRISEKIQKFIDNCRYGQTEIGSYVISLVCPFGNVSEDKGMVQMSLFTLEADAALSTTRKATRKLIYYLF